MTRRDHAGLPILGNGTGSEATTHRPWSVGCYVAVLTLVVIGGISAVAGVPIALDEMKRVAFPLSLRAGNEAAA
jgi:hypothetical protein